LETKLKYHFHSAMNLVSIGGREYAVISSGNSGAGKTTLSNYLSMNGMRKVADDETFLLVEEGRLRAIPIPEGTTIPVPFMGREPGEESYPVLLIIMLTRDSQSECEELMTTPQDVMSNLFINLETLEDVPVILNALRGVRILGFRNCEAAHITRRIMEELELSL